MNEGEDPNVPLSWTLQGPDGFGWNFTPPSGEVLAGKVTTVQLALAPVALQARREAHDSYINLTSNSFFKSERTKRIVISTVVSATPVAGQSRVTLRNTSGLVASGRVLFDILPYDSVGMRILDPPDVTYRTKLLNAEGEGKHTTCSVSDYVGECALPGLVAGGFVLEVLDYTDEPVGGVNGRYSFSVTECPPSFSLDPDTRGCSCDSGFFQREGTLVCDPCDENSVAPARGTQSQCIECPRPSMANLENTECDACREGYFWDAKVAASVVSMSTGNVGFDLMTPVEKLSTASTLCVACPYKAVACAARSRIEDWQLMPGYWRSGEASDDVLECAFGNYSCPFGQDDLMHPMRPKEVVGRQSNCSAWPHCAFGYIGPLCSRCDKNYFPDWWGDDECKTCEGKNHTNTFIFGGVLVVFAGLIGLVVKSQATEGSRLQGFAGFFRKIVEIGKVKSIILFLCIQVISQFGTISRSTGQGACDDVWSSLLKIFNYFASTSQERTPNQHRRYSRHLAWQTWTSSTFFQSPAYLLKWTFSEFCLLKR